MVAGVGLGGAVGVVAGLAGAVGGALLAAILVVATAWWTPVVRIRRGHAPNGLSVGAGRLTATPRGLTDQRSGARRSVAWAEVHEVGTVSGLWLVRIQGAAVVAIPRRAVGDRAAQASFLAQLEAWRAPRRRVAHRAPEPGRDHHRLAYHLVEDDYLLSTSVMRAEQQRGRPVRVALMAALTGGVLLAGTEPWRGGLDAGLVALVAAFSLALVVVGLGVLWVPQLLESWLVRRNTARSPRRMPCGPVALGLGPEGGWLESEGGVSHFDWPELRRVHSDADVVLLLFSDQVAVLVPSRAFEPSGKQDEVVADVERWSRSSRGPIVPQRSTPARAASHANPFEPPGRARAATVGPAEGSSMTAVRSMVVLGAGLVACTTRVPTEPTTPPLDPDVAPVQGEWVKPARWTTWHWQRTSPVDLAAEADLWVVDLFGTTFTELSSIEALGHWAFCEVSAGTWATAQPDGAPLPPDAVGNLVAGATDERWLDVGDPTVQAWARARLDLAVDKGCEGVALTNVDGTAPSTGFDVTRDQQLAYLRHLYNEAHLRGLGVAFTVGADWVPDLVDYADVAITERCIEQDVCGAFDAFPAAGKPLLDAEQASDETDLVAVCVEALVGGVRALILPEGAGTAVSCDGDLPSVGPLAAVETFTSYFGSDGDAIHSMHGRELSIVAPSITEDQRRALQASGPAIAALPVGALGATDRVWLDGDLVLGQAVHDAHPDWFIGEQESGGGWDADPGSVGWQGFVLSQATCFLERGFDGLLLESVDVVDAFPATVDDMVDLVERLDRAVDDALLVQQGAVSLLPRTASSIDGLVLVGFSTRYDADVDRYVVSDPEAAGAESRLRAALTYRLEGGVVFAQDLGEARIRDEALVCSAQQRALEHRFVPSYADVDFSTGHQPYPATCPWPIEPRMRLAFEPAVVHLRPSTTEVVEVSHAGTGGFETTINVSVSDFPPGVSVGVPSSRVKPGASVALTVSAGFSLPIGAWTLPVKGSVVGRSRTYELPVVGHGQSVWVASAASGEVSVFDDPSGAVVPEVVSRRTEDGVPQAFDVAVDPLGGQWVVENEGDPTAKQPAGRVLIFPPFDLRAPRTYVNEGLNYPTGVAIDAAGTGWVVNSALDWSGTARGRPNISTIVEKDSFARVAFRFDEVTYGHPLRLAFAPAGDLFVTTTTGLVLGFPAVVEQVERAPAVVISGADGAFDTVRGAAFDGSGNLWLAAELGGEGRVVALAAGSWSADPDVAEADLAVLITAELAEPWDLAFGDAGELWVVDSEGAPDGSGRVLRYDDLATGATPAQVIPQSSVLTVGIAVGMP